MRFLRSAATGARIPSAVFTALINTAASAVFALVLARLTGPETVGAWSLVLLSAALLSYVLGFGLGAGLGVRTAAHASTEWLSPYWIFSRRAAIGAALLGAGVTYVLAGHRPGAGGWLMALAGGALCAAMTMQLAGQWVGIATGRLAEVTLVSATGTLTAAFAVFSYRFLVGDLPLWVVCVSYALGALPVPVYVHRFLRDPESVPRPADRPTFADLFRAGSGTYATGALLIVLASMDRFVLGHFQGVAAVGIYSAALAAASVARFVPTAIGQVLFVREAAAPQIDRAHRRRARLVVLAAQGIAALIAPLIIWLYGPAFRAAVPIAVILVVAELFMGTALLEYRMLAAKERTRSLLLVAGTVLGVALPLYVVSARVGVISLAGAVAAVSALFAGLLVIERRRFEGSATPTR